MRGLKIGYLTLLAPDRSGHPSFQHSLLQSQHGHSRCCRHSQTQLQQLTLGLLCVLEETLGFLSTFPKAIVRDF